MKLSICIPTYNRKKMLLELLESISEQINEDINKEIEIAVSDNNSDDGTQEAVLSFASGHPLLNIVYHRNNENVGPDRNYVKAVEIASGEYAWIIGSDDRLRKDALVKVLNKISEGFDLYLANRENYSIDFAESYGVEYYFDAALPLETSICLSDDIGWVQYFKLCSGLGGVCSYLSSFFFRRSLFLSSKCYEAYIGSAYVHVYLIMHGLINNPESAIKIMIDPIIDCRLGNDSFYRNRYQRMMLDFDGYIMISSLFTNEMVRKSFLEIVIKEHKFISLKMLRNISRDQCDDLITKMQQVGYDASYISMVYQLNRHKLLNGIICMWNKYYSLKKV